MTPEQELEVHKAVTPIKERLGDKKLLFLALGGSHAYGTDRPDSDVDYRGVHVHSTGEYLGLNPPYRPNPVTLAEVGDVVIHELGKFTSLALANNPNILEILFSPKMIYVAEDFRPFLSCRDTLLSQRCKRTYGGYAEQQIARFQKATSDQGNDAGRWKPEHRHKHLMHCFRLVQQCTSLLETGTLDIVVQNKEELIDLAVRSYDDVDFFQAEYSKRLNYMDTCNTDLPEHPDDRIWDSLIRGYHLDKLYL